MPNSLFKVPVPSNEPQLAYAPGSPEKIQLKKAINDLKSALVDIPLIIGGKEIRTGSTREIRAPHNHDLRLGFFHCAGQQEVELAIEAALKARLKWAEMPWNDRIAIFQKAAELLSGPWRMRINAATMLAQSKTCMQAEIDSACELADFFRFNGYYMAQLMSSQPLSPKGMWNRNEYRPLEGFVLALTPFNFTSIAGNLPTAPAMVGNVVLWKPASTAVYSAYFLMRLLIEAGLPDGVINFIPGPGSSIGDMALASSDLAGVHFTGSTDVFKHIWSVIGGNLSAAKYYPRIVGETGGKDFIFVHNSSKKRIPELVTAAIRGAFEYQGQKCSAASRMYIPKSMYQKFKELYVDQVSHIRVGDPEDFRNFMGAVIDKNAFESIQSYIEYARVSPDAEIITGGVCDSSKGYFIEPTTIVTTDPMFRTMQQEIFGPVLTIYPYDDDQFEATLDLCDSTSPYALTGAIWADDRYALGLMEERLRDAAGNFYINDKPTAAVVGQQPFGGARASGTNDKAGSAMNIMRWISVRTIKETFVPPKDWRYQFLDEE